MYEEGDGQWAVGNNAFCTLLPITYCPFSICHFVSLSRYENGFRNGKSLVSKPGGGLE